MSITKKRLVKKGPARTVKLDKSKTQLLKSLVQRG